MPMARPDLKVRLLHNGSNVTAKLHQTLQQTKHSLSFQQHIMWKANWPQQVFQLIDWSAHEKAFKSLTQSQQITISKITHHLMNPNKQNRLYYGSSDLCPCCNSSKVTFSHILSCSDDATTLHRRTAFQQFLTHLKSTDTPHQTIDALSHGTHHWLQRTDLSQVRALTAGWYHTHNSLYWATPQYRMVPNISG